MELNAETITLKCSAASLPPLSAPPPESLIFLFLSSRWQEVGGQPADGDPEEPHQGGAAEGTFSGPHVGLQPRGTLRLSPPIINVKRGRAAPPPPPAVLPPDVFVFQNMVGRGEVDEDLEEETKEECEKYGKVVKCVIFEVRARARWGGGRVRTRQDAHGGASPFQIAEVPDDEAVRIFLEFERVESAIKGEKRRRRDQEGRGTSK